MNGLRTTVRRLTAYHPDEIVNDFSLLEGLPAAAPDGDVGTQAAASLPLLRDARLPMAELAELLISQVMLLLSLGLHDGVDVWRVLETLKRIPEKLDVAAYQAQKGPAAAPTKVINKGTVVGTPVVTAATSLSSSTTTTPVTAVVSTTRTASSSSTVATTGPVLRGVLQAPSGGCRPEEGRGRGRGAEEGAEAEAAAAAVRCHRQRLSFATQLVRTVESGYADSPSLVRARIFLRLALNYGCLLAALELIARYSRQEIRFFYKSPELNALFHYKRHDRPQQQPSAADRGGDEDACAGSHGDLWEQFQAVMAPAGGVPLRDIEAGATKGFSLLRFRLSLFVKGLDDDLEDHAHPPSLAAYLLSWDQQMRRDAGEDGPKQTSGGLGGGLVVKGVVLPSSSVEGTTKRVVGTVAQSPSPPPPPAAAAAAPALPKASPHPPHGNPPPSSSFLSLGPSPSLPFTSDGFAPVLGSGGELPDGAAVGISSKERPTWKGSASETLASSSSSSAFPPAPRGPVAKCFYRHLEEYLSGLTHDPPPAVRYVCRHILAGAWRSCQQTAVPRKVVTVQVLPLGTASSSLSSTERAGHRSAPPSAASASPIEHPKKKRRKKKKQGDGEEGDDGAAEGKTRSVSPSQPRDHGRPHSRRTSKQRSSRPSSEGVAVSFDEAKGQWISAVVEKLQADMGGGGSSTTLSTSGSPRPTSPSPPLTQTAGEQTGESTRLRGSGDGGAPSHPSRTPPLLARLGQRPAGARPSPQEESTAPQPPQEPNGAASAFASPFPSAVSFRSLRGRQEVLGEVKAPPLVRTLKALRRASGLSQPPPSVRPAEPEHGGTGEDGSRDHAEPTPKQAGVDAVVTAAPPSSESNGGAAAAERAGDDGSPADTAPESPSLAVEDVGNDTTGQPASSSKLIEALLEELATLLEAYEEDFARSMSREGPA